MDWLLSVLALAGGAALPLQVALNTQLKTYLGHPVQATFVSFSVGALAMLAYCLVTRLPWPGAGALAQAPGWVWLGGFLGAFYVWSTIVVAPSLGAAVTLGLVVAGQMTASLVLDHFGVAGLPERPLDLWRVTGVLLVVGGVALTALSGARS